MRRVILMMSVSLEGFFEGPNRELGWHLVDDELHRRQRAAARDERLLEGRVTCEPMARFWPTADTDPASSAPMVARCQLTTHRVANHT